MTSSFPALCNDCIDARCNRFFRLIKTRGCGEKEASCLLQCVDAGRRWHTEMKTDDSRSNFKQQRQHLVIFSKAIVNDCESGRRFGAETAKCRRKCGEPRRFAFRVASRSLVYKNINIEGPLRSRAKFLQHFTCTRSICRTDADGTECSGFGNSSCEFGRRYTRHRRLDDWKGKAKLFEHLPKIRCRRRVRNIVVS